VRAQSAAGLLSVSLTVLSAFPHRLEHEMRRLTVVVLSCGALLVGVAPAWAGPSPPTNGGNGAGQSGQCTGPAADRPASCQSP
jgi:hypothetical protein